MGQNVQQVVSVYNGEEIITSTTNAEDKVTANIGLIRILAKFLSGETASIPSYLAYGDLGSNSEAPDKKHISLQSEFDNTTETYKYYERVRLYNVSAKVTEDCNASLTFTFVDSTDNAWNIKELGIFLGTTGNNLIAEYQPVKAFQKLSDKSLVIDWTITLTIPT